MRSDTQQSSQDVYKYHASASHDDASQFLIRWFISEHPVRHNWYRIVRHMVTASQHHLSSRWRWKDNFPSNHNWTTYKQTKTLKPKHKTPLMEPFQQITVSSWMNMEAEMTFQNRTILLIAANCLIKIKIFIRMTQALDQDIIGWINTNNCKIIPPQPQTTSSLVPKSYLYHCLLQSFYQCFCGPKIEFNLFDCKVL